MSATQAATAGGTKEQRDHNDSALIAAASRLGYAGLIPFVILALFSWGAPGADSFATVTRALVAYAAVIVTFVGAVHWGSVLVAPKRVTGRGWMLVMSVLPALLGWLSLAFDARFALALQAAAFVGFYAYERSSSELLGLPSWYMSLRRRLTIVVVLALAASFAAAQMRAAVPRIEPDGRCCTAPTMGVNSVTGIRVSNSVSGGRLAE